MFEIPLNKQRQIHCFSKTCIVTLLITKRPTKEVHTLMFLNKIAAYLRNVSTSVQGTEKEIATQESSRTASLDSG